ncbi:proteasome subunit alpha type-5 isoform X2 [Anser cygnoides]|uniref:proteasome subunit alpha type-5 isoform X2 n=1 Tax=Anser cygnoides TaxID=8845 RepID=UPI0034D21BF0
MPGPLLAAAFRTLGGPTELSLPNMSREERETSQMATLPTIWVMAAREPSQGLISSSRAPCSEQGAASCCRLLRGLLQSPQRGASQPSPQQGPTPSPPRGLAAPPGRPRMRPRCAMSGLIADAKTLIDKARVETQNHWFTYNETMTVESVTQAVSNLALQFGEEDADPGAMSRPFGVALLFGGVDEKGPQLFHMDPSGTFVQCDARAIGSASEGAQSSLQEVYHKSMTLKEAIKSSLVILKQVMEEKLNATNIEGLTVLGRALNVLRNRIGVKYERNVLRIKRSLLTQVTLLVENPSPEVAALLSSFCRSMWCFTSFTHATSLSCVFFFHLAAKGRGSVVTEQLNPLAATFRNLNVMLFKLITPLRSL